jgi:hypothetical protein
MFSKHSAFPDYANFFEDFPKNNIVEDGFISKILPLTAISSNNSVVEFLIPPLNQCLISPKDIRYVVKFKIVAGDGGNLAEIAEEKDEYFTILNSAASSIFSDIHIMINGQNICSSNNLYPLVGQLQNLISDLNRKRVDFVSRGFTPESGGDAKTINSTPAVIRNKFVAKSKEATFIGNIVNGIFQENQLLPPQTTLGMRMFPSKSGFFIFSKNKTYKMQITSLHLEVKYLKMDSGFLMSTVETMKRQPYVLRHLSIKPKTIVLSSGINNITLANILTGTMPIKLFFTFISNKSLLGTFETNPLNFQPYKLSSYLIRINERCYPSTKLDYSFETGKNYVELYDHFLQNVNLSGGGSVGIDLEQFGSGAFLALENLLYDDGHPFLTQPQSGSMSLELEFSSALTEAVSLVLFPVYAATLSIDFQGRATLKE